jgi:serine/threonine-protein kinase HipA
MTTCAITRSYARRGWVLSPAYDLNPNPHRPDRLSTAIDLDDTKADIETALSVSSYFRLTLAEARSEVMAVSRATSGWQREAADLNLPRSEIDLMAEAFETDQRRAANASEQ